MKKLILGCLVLVLASVPAGAATMSLGKTAASAGALMTCNSARLGRLGLNTADGNLYVCNGTANVMAGQAVSANVPSASVTAGVTAVDRNFGPIHQTIYTLTAVAISVVDSAGAAGGQGSIQLYDYPAGSITILGATSDLAITEAAAGIGDTAAVICSMGQVVAAAADSTLTTTEADTMPSTAATLTGSAGACDGEMTTALLAIQDGTATAKDLYLNVAIPDAGISATAPVAVSGTITVTYLTNGDN